MSSLVGPHITNMFKSAFRENLVPGLIIQILAVLLVVSYYCWPTGKLFWTHWAEFKLNCGITYVFISTAVFGGLIPGIYMWWLGRINRRLLIANLIFFALFWGYRGVEARITLRRAIMAIWRQSSARDNHRQSAGRSIHLQSRLGSPDPIHRVSVAAT